MNQTTVLRLLEFYPRIPRQIHLLASGCVTTENVWHPRLKCWHILPLCYLWMEWNSEYGESIGRPPPPTHTHKDPTTRSTYGLYPVYVTSSFIASDSSRSNMELQSDFFFCSSDMYSKRCHLWLNRACRQRHPEAQRDAGMQTGRACRRTFVLKLWSGCKLQRDHKMSPSIHWLHRWIYWEVL